MERKFVVVTGEGQTSDENLHTLLNDAYGSLDESGLEMVFALHSTAVGTSLDEAVNWSAAAGLPMNVIVAEGTAESLESFLADADNAIEVEDVNQTIINLLLDAREKGSVPVILFLWDDSADLDSLLEAACKVGIECGDLTDGLDSISYIPNEEEETDPEPDPEPAPNRRNRGRKSEPEKELVAEEKELTAEPHQTTVEEQIADAEAEAVDLPHDRDTKAGTRTATGTATVPETATDTEVRAVKASIEINMIQAIIRNEVRKVLGAALAALEGDTGSGTPAFSERPSADRESSGSVNSTSTDRYQFVIYNDGTVTKRGRGRIRQDAEVVELTLDEARARGYED